MYARIAFFEGGDATTAETVRRLAKEQFLPRLKSFPGFAGVIDLGQPEAGKGVSIVLFDSKEDLENGDRELNAMNPPPELSNIRRTAVEKYEVVMQELHDAAAARVSRLEGSPETIDEGIRVAEESIFPQARQIEGFQGVLSLVDRTSGRTMIVTFWESKDAMQRSEEQADRLRAQAAEAGRETITSVERYEVATLEVPAGIRR